MLQDIFTLLTLRNAIHIALFYTMIKVAARVLWTVYAIAENSLLNYRQLSLDNK